MMMIDKPAEERERAIDKQTDNVNCQDVGVRLCGCSIGYFLSYQAPIIDFMTSYMTSSQ